MNLTPDVPAFRDPDLPVEVRVDDLVARLTMAEKVDQLGMDTQGVPRLGIPAYQWWNEALHGVARNGLATVFPQAIALAATWNPALVQRIADAISTEARAKHHATLRKSNGASRIYEGLTLWSPNINIFRDPRWGRGQETYGECPFLTSRFAVAFCQGLQGNDPRYLKTVATVKHFAVHSGPESERHTFDARPKPRDLWETYLPAFEAGIIEGGAQSLMSVYNAVDGVPGPVNRRLLTEILRERWGFRGAVVGDVDCVHDVHAHHKFTRDAAESASLALRAGNDLCSGATYAALPEALSRGLCSEADLDNALRRLLCLRFRLGQFDPPERVSYAAIPESANDCPAHDDLALEAARQSLVLLKNDGVLPLDSSRLRTLAVIGPVADDRSALLGNYAGTPARPVTILEGLRRKLTQLGVAVVHEPGCVLASGFPANQFAFGPGQLFNDDSRSMPGVRGEFWPNPDLAGPPDHTRSDPQLDLEWDYYHPLPQIAVRNASARWTGVMVPPVTGSFKLDLTLVGGARLWLDGTLVLDEWGGGPFRIRTLQADFVAGLAVGFRLELTQNQFTAKARLGWRLPYPLSDLERALAAAQSADHVVLALGITPDLEGEENPFSCEGFISGDRTTLSLPTPQIELLDAVAALGKPVTMVLTGGAALAFKPEQAGAVLLAWYYGQRGGEAVAEAILGEINPAGRLPVTFYRSEADLPSFSDYSMSGRTYRYFSGRPLFAFGHGLSYTTFAYHALAYDALAGVARVRVANTGAREGDEVVQVYARDARPGRPLLQLCGFTRVRLAAGEERSIAAPVDFRALRRWDEAARDYVLESCSCELLAGPASDQLPLRRSVVVTFNNSAPAIAHTFLK
ncbi:glycoside hydrolase family 3 protein [bacterium]|nr:glycoside hydrolase family 3 protein [bacterium]